MTSEEAKKVYGDKHNEGYVCCDKCPVFDNCPEGRAGTGFGDCWEAIAENAPATADVNVCEKMLDQALIENANMAEKIERQEELIAKQEAEIEIQKRTLSELKDDLDWSNEEISRLEHDNEILKAKMEVVRMIFGGRGNE